MNADRDAPRRNAGTVERTLPGKTTSAPRATPFFAEVRSEPDLGATETNATSSPTTLRAPVWADYASSGASPPARGRAAARPSAARFWGRRVLRSPWRSPWAGSAALVVSPETSTVLVSMGNTWGSDKARCPSGLRDVAADGVTARAAAREPPPPEGSRLAPGTTRGYDEAVLMRQLWHAVGDAARPPPRGAAERGEREPPRACRRLARSARPRRKRSAGGEAARRRRRRRRARGLRRLRARKGVGEGAVAAAANAIARGGGLRGEAPGRLRGARGGGKTRRSPREGGL